MKQEQRTRPKNQTQNKETKKKKKKKQKTKNEKREKKRERERERERQTQGEKKGKTLKNKPNYPFLGRKKIGLSYSQNKNQTKNKPNKKTHKKQKQTNKWGGPKIRPKNKTTNPTCPPKKHIFVRKVGLTTWNGCKWKSCHLCLHVGRCCVFCTYTNKFLEIALGQNKSEQNCAKLCFAQSHQTTKHPCMHPPWTKNVFLGFEMPTQKSTNVIKTFRNCASFVDFIKNPNWKSSKSTISNKSKMAKTIFWHFHLTPLRLPILWNPYYFCNANMKWPSTLTQVDKWLTVKWTRN